MKPTFVQLIEQVEPFVSPEMFNEIIIAFGYHPDMDIIVNDDNFFIGMHGDVLIVSNSILCEIVKNNFDVINNINLKFQTINVINNIKIVFNNLT